MKRIGFDHCYQFSLDRLVYSELGRRGFAVNENNQIEHPGGRFCQFIWFESRNHVTHGRHSQYLEFVWLRDMKTTQDYFRAQGEPYDELKITQPGYSLIVDKNLKELANVASGTKYKHKNYDWMKNDTDHLPGWNYLEFEPELYRGIHTWFTEYEPSPGRQTSRQTSLPRHENTCSAIKGVVWMQDPEQTARLTRVVGRSIVENRILLDDGTSICLYDEPLLQREFQGRKTHPFWAVLIECEDFDAFKKKALPDTVLDFQGRQAGLIRLSSLGWDLLVVPSTSK